MSTYGRADISDTKIRRRRAAISKSLCVRTCRLYGVRIAPAPPAALKHPDGAASLYSEPPPPPPDVDQSGLGRRERIDVDGPRAAQETAEPIRQHGHQPRAQRIAELRYA